MKKEERDLLVRAVRGQQEISRKIKMLFNCVNDLSYSIATHYICFENLLTLLLDRLSDNNEALQNVDQFIK